MPVGSWGSGLIELPSRAARDLGKGSSGVEARLASSIQTAVCECMTEVWRAIWREFGEPWRMENAPIDSRVLISIFSTYMIRPSRSYRFCYSEIVSIPPKVSAHLHSRDL